MSVVYNLLQLRDGGLYVCNYNLSSQSTEHSSSSGMNVEWHGYMSINQECGICPVEPSTA